MVARRGKLLTLATPRRMRFERVFSRIAGCLVFSTRRRALLAGIAAGFGSFCASTAAQADQPAVAAPASPDLIGPIAGALAIGPAGTLVRVAAPKVKVVDTIGAGDVFNAAFLAALADDFPLADCLAAGTTVASRAISTLPRNYGALPHGEAHEHA